MGVKNKTPKSTHNHKPNYKKQQHAQTTITQWTYCTSTMVSRLTGLKVLFSETSNINDQ